MKEQTMFNKPKFFYTNLAQPRKICKILASQK